MSVKFTDHSADVLAAMERAKKQALTAIGLEAVGITNDYMQSKYGAPIYDTGELIRSIAFNVREADDVVDVGSNLDYAPWVHNGTSRMRARPFLKDAITENGDIWREIASEHIGEEIK